MGGGGFGGEVLKCFAVWAFLKGQRAGRVVVEAEGVYTRPLSFLPLPLLTSSYVVGAQCKPKEMNVSHGKCVSSVFPICCFFCI